MVAVDIIYKPGLLIYLIDKKKLSIKKVRVKIIMFKTGRTWNA